MNIGKDFVVYYLLEIADQFYIAEGDDPIVWADPILLQTSTNFTIIASSFPHFNFHSIGNVRRFTRAELGKYKMTKISPEEFPLYLSSCKYVSEELEDIMKGFK